jgi:hypothetical protein
MQGRKKRKKERKTNEKKPASNPAKKAKKEGHTKRKGDEEEVKAPPKLFRGKVVTVAVSNSTKTSKPTSKKRDAVALFDEKDNEDEGKGDEEDVKPLPKVSKGKAVKAAEFPKASRPTSKKRDAVVLLDDEDDEDERPYRKRIVGWNNIRPPLPHKLVRSPEKKEDYDPASSDYSKQLEDGTFSGSGDDFFGSEKVKEDSTVCSLLYSVVLFVKHFINFFKLF